MAMINRRTGIVGITIGALLCLLCGVPFIAALVGVGGISIGTIMSDSPPIVKVAVFIGSLSILALTVVFLARRRSKQKQETNL